MRSRGTVSRKPAKPQQRKPTRPKRSNAPTAARHDLQEQLDARTRQLNEAIEREHATAEVLRVISSSPGYGPRGSPMRRRKFIVLLGVVGEELCGDCHCGAR